MTMKTNLEWIFNDTPLPDPHSYGDTLPNKQRRIKTVFLMIGRGNRKTTLAAAIELLHTVGPERVPQGLAVSIANDRDQARLHTRKRTQVSKARGSW
jgi:hypothetical protein